MEKESTLEVTGTVVEKLPGCKFWVELENGHRVMAYLSGKLATNYIKVSVGDTVNLDISPYDLSKGRITWRNR